MREDVFGLCGTTISEKYRVDSVVGEGGFGIVYRGWHNAFETPVAVKCLIERSELGVAREQFLEGFRREATLLDGLLDRHPAFVRVYDFGTTATPSGATPPYLILEWLDGQDLEAALAARRARGEGPYSEREALALLRPAIEAMAAAHQGPAPVAHRDLKPANLFIANSAQPMKVLDFGIAKVMEAGDTATSLQGTTRSSIQYFSPSYGAPEQFDSQMFGSSGPWTDVHALALILVELVTGKIALSGETRRELMLSAISPTRPTPRAAGCAVSDVFEALCSKALALKPTDRYRDAAQLLAAVDAATATALRPVRRAPSAPVATPARTKPVQPRWRDKRWIGAGLAVLLAGYFLFNRDSAPCDGTDLEPCTRQCADGDANSCTKLGTMYITPVGVKKDSARARQLFEQGCQGDDARGCIDLGNALLHDSDTVKEPAQAAAFFKRACDLRDTDGCVALGALYRAGTGVAQSLDKARQIFDWACQQDNLNGCDQIASTYLNSDGTANNFERAATYFSKGCDLDRAESCAKLGLVYWGSGDPARQTMAAQLFKKACDGGSAIGCSKLKR